jgi:FixJ family two-component response regulator
MPSPISTIFVVDADPSVGESLEPLIRGAGWQTKAFASAEEFVAMPRIPAPGCLLLDISAPHLRGLEFQKRVADRPEMPVILLSCHGDASMIVKAMKAGAFDFFTKPFDPQVLMEALELALACSTAALREERDLQGLRDRYESLSPREREVMSLVVSGLLNKEVGGELEISEITVKQHRGKVMRKMRAKSLPDLVRMATNLGLSIVPKKRFAADRAPNILTSGDNLQRVRPVADVRRAGYQGDGRHHAPF